MIAAIFFSHGALAASTPSETIVFLRHGEKPPAGLGQLDCQGLNRALALPPVLARQFGRPAAIFAPNPGYSPSKPGTYSYVRPLATIEPTAIALGLPVRAEIEVHDLNRLVTALRRPTLSNAIIYVAWEHHDIVKLARRLMQDTGGDARVIPPWAGSDYDSLYVLRIGPTRTAFEHLQENLNGQSKTCPS